MIVYNERRRPIMLEEGIHDFGAYCDNCAEDLRQSACVQAIVYGEHVVLCSGSCLAELQRVWAPRKRVWPIKQGLQILTIIGACWIMLSR